MLCSARAPRPPRSSRVAISSAVRTRRVIFLRYLIIHCFCRCFVRVRDVGDWFAGAPDPLRRPAAPLAAGRASPITTGSLLAHQPHRVGELDDAAPASPLVLSVAVARATVGVRGGRGVAGREQRVLVDGLGVARDGPSWPRCLQRHEGGGANQRRGGYDSSSSRHAGSTGAWRAPQRCVSRLALHYN